MILIQINRRQQSFQIFQSGITLFHTNQIHPTKRCRYRRLSCLHFVLTPRKQSCFLHQNMKN